MTNGPVAMKQIRASDGVQKVAGRPMAGMVDSADGKPVLIGRAIPFGKGEIR